MNWFEPKEYSSEVYRAKKKKKRKEKEIRQSCSYYLETLQYFGTFPMRHK